jgi:hypothetical protein
MSDKPANNEDKHAWYAYGEQLEREFLASTWDTGISVYRNPDKHTNVWAHDMYAVFPADLKSIRTPFRTAQKYNFDPKYAITLNDKDIKNYSNKAPTIQIFFDIQYEDYQGLHVAPLGYVLSFIEGGHSKYHEYLNRKTDTSGNAKGSWLFDCRWFPKLK